MTRNAFEVAPNPIISTAYKSGVVKYRILPFITRPLICVHSDFSSLSFKAKLETMTPSFKRLTEFRRVEEYMPQRMVLTIREKRWLEGKISELDISRTTFSSVKVVTEASSFCSHFSSSLRGDCVNWAPPLRRDALSKISDRTPFRSPSLALNVFTVSSFSGNHAT